MNRALDRISLIKDRNNKKNERRLASIKGTKPDLEKIGENIWVLDPRVILESVNRLPVVLFNYFNKRNNRLLAREITDACNRLAFKNTYLFIDNDFFRALYLPEMLKPLCSIYYIRDFLTKQPYFLKHGARAENLLMKKCGIVVANSGYLANYARLYNPASFDIGQGCDFSLFNIDVLRGRPADLPVGKPVIGYVGAIVTYRLDEALLQQCAILSPHLNWVFVGPQDEEFRKSALHQMENVHFLGPKPEVLLPDYINSFDVCINPQLVNEATLGNYPRKVDEYLALGKPVVTTYTDFMRSFEPFVELCSGAEEYLLAIQRSLNEKDRLLERGRRQFAMKHTWENSVNKLYQVLPGNN